MTSDERHTVLSALIDREVVDPDALAAALDDPAGRATLVDFVRLRLELQREDAGSDNLDTGSAATARRSHRRMWRLAAAVLLPLAIGAAGGAWWTGRRDAMPPEPTRIIQFRPGVDWHSNTLLKR
jgi:hypothetical protein